MSQTVATILSLLLLLLLQFHPIYGLSDEAVPTYVHRIDARQDKCQYMAYVWINCSSTTQELDIKSEFQRISSESWARTYPFFYWTANLTQGVLPEEVFSGLRLVDVRFLSNNLKRIHSSAFEGMLAGSVESWIHQGKSQLRNYQSTAYDLFEAFSGLRELQNLSISLDSEGSHDIPDNAFESNQWNQLIQITFTGNFSVSRIGSQLIYSLPKSFSKINFEGVSIELISENAFQTQSCSGCQPIYVGLEWSRLSENRVQSGAFDSSGRALHLHLG